ncbi:MAG: DUF3800 domain-containing protein [Candidatus Gracilibacteria bacterium]|nr:DUF3800 domain-containing protein [Candidatus Gracilibacteria bacterium]MDD5179320.1 DUF3800 domain-containing protein [Candidatus Gracilibacteria bacterium]
MPPTNCERTIYIFIDEAGDLNFTRQSSKYISLTALVCVPDNQLVIDLYNKKHLLLPFAQSKKKELEYFHASEDLQIVRDEVFNSIQSQKNLFVYSVFVEKRKTYPALQFATKIYTKMCIWLMHGVLYGIDFTKCDRIMIFFDNMPVGKNKQAMFKGLKKELSDFFIEKNITIPYWIFNHQSKSNTYLQVVDYLAWALYAKNERGEERPFNLIKHFVKNEFHPFSKNSSFYY